jgi:hypothetical protein
MAIIGNFERLEDGFAIGWAYVQGQDNPVHIEVTLNGDLVAAGMTGGLRPDVCASGGPISAGFEIPLPSGVWGGSGELSVIAGGELIGERSLTRMLRPAKLFAGSVEQMVGSVVTGWAVNLENPLLPVTLTVFLGARPIDAIVTNVPRQDVQVQFGTRTPAGFAYPTPSFLRSGAPGLLRFVIANTDIEIGGSPFLLGGRRSTDNTALQSLAGQGGARVTREIR